MASTREHLKNSDSWGVCGGYPAGNAGFRSNGDSGHTVSDQPAPEMKPVALTRIIEAEIIPRLMLAHRCELLAPVSGPDGDRKACFEDVAEMTRIVAEHDVGVACGYVDALRAQGLSLETLYIDVIAPAAQLLGKMWTADLADFNEVTIGLSRLQQVLHRFGPDFESEGAGVYGASRALLTTLPGDQHTFGILMVEEFFRRAGWDVRGGPFGSTRDLVKAVRSERFDLIGLSVGSEVLLGDLTSVIGALRKASCNAAVQVVVGGRLFVEHPEYVERVGADGTATDAREAVLRLPFVKTAGVAVTR